MNDLDQLGKLLFAAALFVAVVLALFTTLGTRRLVLKLLKKKNKNAHHTRSA